MRLAAGRDDDESESVGTVERQATIAVVKEAIEALVLHALAVYAAHGRRTLGDGSVTPRASSRAGWPAFDEAVARAEEIVVPVQINGKVAIAVTVAADTAEDELRELALADPQVAKYLAGKTVRKSLSSTVSW